MSKSVNKISFEIDGEVKLGVEQAEKSIVQLQSYLNKLSLPNNTKSKLGSTISGIQDTIAKYKQAISSTEWSKGDADKLTGYYNKIALGLQKIQTEFKNLGQSIDINQLMPVTVTKSLKEAEDLIKSYNKELDKVAKSGKKFSEDNKIKSKSGSLTGKKTSMDSKEKNYTESQREYELAEQSVQNIEKRYKKASSAVKEYNKSNEKTVEKYKALSEYEKKRDTLIKSIEDTRTKKQSKENSLKDKLYNSDVKNEYNAYLKTGKEFGFKAKTKDAIALKRAIDDLDSDLKQKEKELENLTNSINKNKVFEGKQVVKSNGELDKRQNIKGAYDNYEKERTEKERELNDIESELAKAKKERNRKQTSMEEDKFSYEQSKKDYEDTAAAVEALNKQLDDLNAAGKSEAFKTLVTGLQSYSNQLDETNTDQAELKEKLEQFLEGFEDTGNAEKNIENLKNGLKAIGMELGGEQKLAEILEEVAEGANKVNEGLDKGKNAPKVIKEQIDQYEKVQGQLTQMTSRLEQFFTVANGFRLISRSVRKAFNEVKTLDKAMTETAVVTNFSVGDMWDKLPEYTETANKYGATIEDTYKVMTIFYQQGLKTNEVFQVGTETMKMARIAGLDYSDAADKMTNALRAFNMEITEANAATVNDVYSNLAANSASNVKELSTAMTKVASLAASANMTLQNTGAFLAQIIETTRESAETAGTALKTVVARFAEVKELYSNGQIVGATEEGEEININKVGEALRAAGIDLNEFMMGNKGLDDILLELADRWDSLDLLTQRYIATMAAGSRQQSRFLALMSDNKRLTELTSLAYNSAGASTSQFQKTQESLETKLNKLKNAWDEFILGITNSSVVKFGVDILTGMLDVVNDLTESSNKLAASANKLGVALSVLFAGGAIVRPLIAGVKNIGAGAGETFLGGFKQAILNGGQGTINRLNKQIKATSGSVDTKYLNAYTKKYGNDAAASYLDEKDKEKRIQLNTQAQEAYNEQLVTTSQNYQAVATAGLIFGTALMGLGQQIENSAGGANALSIATKGLGIAITAASGALAAYIMIAKLATLATKEFGATMLKYLPEVAAIVAIVAALGLLVYVIYNGIKASKESNKQLKELTKSLKSASKAAEDLTNQANKTAEALENITSSFEKLDKAKENLKNLVQGTAEWKNEMLQANEIALQIQKDALNNGIELTLNSDDNGLYYFEQDQKEILEQLEKQKASINAEASAANARVERLGKQQNALSLMREAEKLDGRTSQSDWSSGFSGATKKQLQNLQQQYNNLIDQANSQYGLSFENSLRQYFSTFDETYSETVLKGISDQTSSNLDQLLKEESKKVTAQDKAAYANENNLTFKDNKFYDENDSEVKIDDETVAYAKAFSQAMDTAKESADNLAKAFKQLDASSGGDNIITKVFGRSNTLNTKDFAKITKNLSPEKIQKVLLNNGKVTEEGKQLLMSYCGLTEEQIKDLKPEEALEEFTKELQSAIKDIVETNINNQEGFIKTIMLAGVDEIPTELGNALAQLSSGVIEQLTSIAENWGAAGGETLVTSLSQAIQKGAGEEIARAFGNIKFDNIIDSYDKLLKIISVDGKDSVTGQLAQQLLDTDTFNKKALLTGIQRSEDWEEIKKSLDKSFKKNHKITYKDVDDLVKQFQTLGNVIDDDIFTVEQLTKVFNAIETGDLTFDDFTDSVMEAISQVELISDLLNDVHSTIENFDEGLDSAEGINWLSDSSESMWGFIEKGQFANEKLIRLIEEIFGSDYLRDSNGEYLDRDQYNAKVRQAYSSLDYMMRNEGASFWSGLGKGETYQVVDDGSGITIKFEDGASIDDITKEIAQNRKISQDSAKMLLAGLSAYDINVKKQLEEKSIKEAVDAYARSIGDNNWGTLDEVRTLATALGVSADSLVTALEEVGVTLIDVSAEYKDALGNWKPEEEIVQAIAKKENNGGLFKSVEDGFEINTDNIKDILNPTNVEEGKINGIKIDGEVVNDIANSLSEGNLITIDSLKDYFRSKGVNDEGELNNLVNKVVGPLQKEGYEIGQLVTGYDKNYEEVVKGVVLMDDTTTTVEQIEDKMETIWDDQKVQSAAESFADELNKGISNATWYRDLYKAITGKEYNPDQDPDNPKEPKGNDSDNDNKGNNNDDNSSKGAVKNLKGKTYRKDGDDWYSVSYDNKGNETTERVTDETILNQLNGKAADWNAETESSKIAYGSLAGVTWIAPGSENDEISEFTIGNDKTVLRAYQVDEDTQKELSNKKPTKTTENVKTGHLNDAKAFYFDGETTAYIQDDDGNYYRLADNNNPLLKSANAANQEQPASEQPTPTPPSEAEEEAANAATETLEIDTETEAQTEEINANTEEIADLIEKTNTLLEDLKDGTNKTSHYAASYSGPTSTQTSYTTGEGQLDLSEAWSLANKYGKEYDVPPALLMAVMQQESDFTPGLVGDKGKAFGLMQIWPKWWQKKANALGLGDFTTNYEHNVAMGAYILGDLIDKYDGDTSKALAYYNGGSNMNYSYAAQVQNKQAYWDTQPENLENDLTWKGTGTSIKTDFKVGDNPIYLGDIKDKDGNGISYSQTGANEITAAYSTKDGFTTATMSLEEFYNSVSEVVSPATFSNDEDRIKADTDKITANGEADYEALYDLKDDYAGHNGWDYTPKGDDRNIYSKKAGTVIAVNKGFNQNTYGQAFEGWNGWGYGNFVLVDNDDGTKSIYAHMSQNTATVKPGDKIEAGVNLGTIGNTGNSKGPHLHYGEFNSQGAYVKTGEDRKGLLDSMVSRYGANGVGPTYNNSNLYTRNGSPSYNSQAGIYDSLNQPVYSTKAIEEKMKQSESKQKQLQTMQGWLTDYNPISKSILIHREMANLNSQRAILNQYDAAYRADLENRLVAAREVGLGYNYFTNEITGIKSEQELSTMGSKEREQYEATLEQLSTSADNYRQNREAILDNMSQKFEKQKEQREVIYGVIDKINEVLQSALQAVGQLAQAAWDCAKKLGETFVQALDSVLKLINTRVDDEHDLNAMSQSLKNRTDRYTWEYERLLKRHFEIGNELNEATEKYTNGVQQELRDNLQLQAKNLMMDVRLQQQLYNNSKNAVEAYEKSIFNTAADAILGINDRINKGTGQVEGLATNFVQSLLTSVNTGISSLGGNKGIADWLESKIGDIVTAIGGKTSKIFSWFSETNIGEKLGLKALNDALTDYTKNGIDFQSTMLGMIRNSIPDYNEDFDYVNKSELIDTFAQTTDSILSSDTLTVKAVKAMTDFITERTNLMEQEAGNMQTASKAILEDINSLTELLKTGKQDYDTLQQQIFDAVVDVKTQLKDELEALNENISNADTDLTDLLKQNIDLIRQQRENDKTENDLANKERELAYLRQDTSNGNLQDILKLEDELKENQQSYTDKLIDQKLSDLQKQNEEAADQRQIQIDLLQEEIDDAKITWSKVEELMAHLDELENGEIIEGVWSKILDLLEKTTDYKDSSIEQQENLIQEWSSQMRNASNYLYLSKDEELTDFLKLAETYIDTETGLLDEWSGTRETIDNIYTKIDSIEKLGVELTGRLPSSGRWGVVDSADAGKAIDQYIENNLPTTDYEKLILGQANIAGGIVRTTAGLEALITETIDHLVSDGPGIMGEFANGLAEGAKAVGAGVGGMINVLDQMLGTFLSSVFNIDIKAAAEETMEFMGSSLGGYNLALPSLEAEFIQDLSIFGEALGYAMSAASHFMAAGADLGTTGLGIVGDGAAPMADIVIGIGETAVGIRQTTSAILDILKGDNTEGLLSDLDPKERSRFFSKIKASEDNDIENDKDTHYSLNDLVLNTKAFREKIAEGSEKIELGFKSLWDKINGFFVNNIDGMFDNLTKLVGKEIDIIKNIYEKVKEGPAFIINGIKGLLSFVRNGLTNSGAGADETEITTPLVEIEVSDITIEAEQVNLITKNKLEDLLLNNASLGSTISGLKIVPIDIAGLTAASANGISQSSGDFTTNINLNLDNLMVDSVDRVEEVAEAVLEKINEVASDSSWPYNSL